MNIPFIGTNSGTEYEYYEVEQSEEVTQTFTCWAYEVTLVDGTTVRLENGRIDEREGGIALQKPSYHGYVDTQSTWHLVRSDCPSDMTLTKNAEPRIREKWGRERFFSYPNFVTFEKTRTDSHDVTRTVEWTETHRREIEA